MCRSRRELSNECPFFLNILFESDPYSNEYLVAKNGFDTAEKEPCKVFPLSVYRSPRCWPQWIQYLRCETYLITEMPESGKFAAKYSTGMFVMIILSIVAFVLEAEPWLMQYKQVWTVAEAFFSILFSVELVIRWWSCAQSSTCDPRGWGAVVGRYHQALNASFVAAAKPISQANSNIVFSIFRDLQVSHS